MDTDTPNTEAAPTRRRNITASLKGIFFTLMVLSAVWFGLRYVLTPIISSQTDAPAPVLESGAEERFKALEEKVAALEKQTPATIDTTPLEARIAALENAPKAVEKEATPTISHEELDALKIELEKLKSTDHGYVRGIILISQLQDAIRAGRPFASEFSSLALLRPDMKETLTPLTQASSTGIATLVHLQEQFAHAISPALTQEGSKKSITQNLRSLVKIRKIGESQTGTDDQAVIARAEAKLAKGDVAAALQETNALSPHALQNFAAWQERAKEHLAAQAAMAALQSQLAVGASE